MSTHDQGSEREKQARLSHHKMELGAYGLRGLEGRMQHGLDPAAMMAVSEVREKVQEVADLVGADMSAVDELTKKLHIGGIWKEAKRLAAAEDGDVVVWHVLASECEEKNAAGEILDDERYLADVERVKAHLENLSRSLDAVRAAVASNIAKAKGKFSKVGDVAYAEGGAFPFTSMAVAGEKSGVWKDGELYFVGAERVDFNVLAEKGYSPVEREDRGRMVTFWQKDGQDVVKALYPGFGIILNGDKKLACALAESASAI